jgi:hypothetical protein
MGAVTSSSMAEAMRYFSGGAYIPSAHSPVLLELQARIQAIGATCHSFLYFFVHYHDPSIGLAGLRRHNQLASAATFAAFTDWYRLLPERTGNVVKSQLLSVQRYAIIGLNIPDVLVDPRESLSAIVRMEAALVHGCLSDELYQSLSFEAEYMLKGNPTYAQLCPRATEKLTTTERTEREPTRS